MSEKRYCKKCGRELASINDGKVCQHCRREKGKLLKTVGKVAGTVVSVAGTLVVGGVALYRKIKSK